MADIAEWEKAYAAGLFDGEGCVQVYMKKSGVSYGRKNRSLATALSVAGVDLRPLHWLQGRYQGSLRIAQPAGERMTNRRPLGIWQVLGFQAEEFARDIHPYLLVKKEQMDLWFQAREMLGVRGYNGPGGIPEDEVAARRELVEEVKRLKRVGSPGGEASSQT